MLLVHSSIILLGFAAMVSQIVLIREFFIAFHGNEISTGVFIAFWLLWGAVGAVFSGVFSDKFKDKTGVLSLCQFVLAVLIPFEILMIRYIKPVLGIMTGEIVSFNLMFISGLLILAPVCVVNGFIFSLACTLLKKGETPEKIGRVYYMEAIGSMAGGIIASFILIRFFSSIHIAVFLSLLLFLFSGLLQFSKEKKNKLAIIALAAFFICNVFMLLGNLWKRIDGESFKASYKGYELLSAENSIYGNVAVVKRGGQVSFFYDGIRIYTTSDERFAEESVHFALLQHPSPKNVLLIGGGTAGLLREILKHPVDNVDYIELDPLLIVMAQKYLSEEALKPLYKDKVKIRNVDGRFFVKRTERRYDCIIVSAGAPLSARLNRFYTVDFFIRVKEILGERNSKTRRNFFIRTFRFR